MHGGAKGSGAPRGNRNALKHGMYTRREIEGRRRLRMLIDEAEELLIALCDS
jgi:glucans biosynthesis protein